MTDLEQLKHDPRVMGIYRDHVRLTKESGLHVGCCPFHSEKSPSFKVDSNLRYHCYGCGKDGDVFEFVKDIEKVSFKEAVERVQNFLGTWDESKEKVEQTFRKAIDTDKTAVSFTLEQWKRFETSLWDSREAKEWLLSERGITYETAKKLRLGFVQNIKNVAGEAGADIADQGWIAFPSLVDNQVVSIKFRSIKRKKPGGFARNPGMKTALFNTDAIDPFEPLYVTEGEFDCAVLVQAGFNAISLPSAGAKLTPEMKDQLMRASIVILSGDSDETGSGYMNRLWRELDRCYLLQWPTGMKDANQTFIETCGRDTKKFFQLVEELTEVAKKQPMPDVYSIQQVLEQGSENLADNPARLHFPWREVDEMVIVNPGAVLGVMSTNTGQGKALAHGTGVMTPSGSVPIEKIKVGDLVIGSDGRPTRVTGVYPQGKKEAYRVSFNDDTCVVCCGEHLWSVHSPYMKGTHGKYRTLSVREILEMDKKGKGLRTGSGHSRGYRHQLPTVRPAEFTEASLPLDPYLLGSLLGDGGFSCASVTFTNTDPECLEQVTKVLPKGTVLSGKEGRIQYVIRTENYQRWGNPVRESLRSMLLWGRKSKDKFIPEVYKYSSVGQRTALLQGLLDTDGCATKNNGVEFVTGSFQLMEDLVWLVRSLGGYTRFTSRTRKKEGRPCSTEYYARLSLPEEIVPFRLSRKLARLKKRRVTKSRGIESITPVEPTEMTCISVEAEDGLYVIDDFIVTHNTAFVTQVSLFNAIHSKDVVLNWQCELSPEEMATMIAAQLTRTNRNFMTKEARMRASKNLGDAEYYIGNSANVNTATGVLDVLEAGIRRLGATLVILDNLSYYTTREEDENKVQAAAITRMKEMSVKYGVKFIPVFQPRKATQQTKGKRTHITDIRGSASLGDTCDSFMAIHREIAKVNEGETKKDTYDSKTYVEMLKTRSKGIGGASAELMFFGEYGEFVTLDSHREEN